MIIFLVVLCIHHSVFPIYIKKDLFHLSHSLSLPKWLFDCLFKQFQFPVLAAVELLLECERAYIRLDLVQIDRIHNYYLLFRTSRHQLTQVFKQCILQLNAIFRCQYIRKYILQFLPLRII